MPAKRKSPPKLNVRRFTNEIIFICAASILIILGLLYYVNQGTMPIPELQPQHQNAQLANPASVYCAQKGGTNQIVTAANGSQSGNCVFKNGSFCDEWAYFRKECKPGQNYPK